MSAPDPDSTERYFARARACRERCSADPALAGRLHELRAWQAQRLARNYQDLRRDAASRRALDFFLQDLYGSQDFTARDQAFERAWPLLRHTLPEAVRALPAQAVELHALTSELDEAMAHALAGVELTDRAWLAAYRVVGRAAERARQIDLIAGIGGQLARLVRRPGVHLALLAARVPAQALGFGVLQGFLERGYQAFRGLSDPRAFLAAIGERETRLMHALLAGADAPALELLQRRGAGGAGAGSSGD